MKKAVIFLFFFFACTAFKQAVSQTTITIALQSGSSDDICGNFASVSFVATTNCSNPTYQWFVNNTAIGGQTGAQLSYNSFSNGDVVTCKQTNATPPCGEATSNGITITFKPNQAINWINSSGNVNQTMCQYTSITPIKFQVIGATNATASGLPTGVTGTYNNGEFVISGAPTQNGTFNYQVSTTGNNLCGSTAQTSGNLTVTQSPNLSFEDLEHPFSPFNNCDNTTGSPIFLIRINNTSANTNGIGSYKINWGDGQIENNVLPASFPKSHTYTTFGVFSLEVTATNNVGCTFTWIQQVVNQTNPAIGIEGPQIGSTQGCDQAGYWFKLRNYSGNTAGTTYTWDFGDATSTVLWTTPVLVDSIFHTFTKTSCGLPLNQFIVSITAKNSCASTPATLGNIKIFKKPVANFSVGNNSECVNKSIAFSNTSTAATNGPSCTTTTAYAWNFGDPGSGANTSTSFNASHTYTSAGPYNVRLIATGSCGSDTIIKTVCITSILSPSFTIDNATGCLPFTVTATNTTDILNSCIPVTYNWSVTYANANCGSSSDWSFASGTNANSTNPAFLFKKAGKYTIKLSVTNPCGTFTTSKTVDIKQAPTASFTIPTSICVGTAINPTSQVTNCGTTTETYLWNFSGGTPATSTSANPTNIAFSAGSQNITLGVTNECGTTTINKPLTVYNPPTLTVPANKTVCAGTSTGNFSFTSDGSISWTIDKTGIGVPSNATSGTGNTINAFTTINSTSNPIMVKIVVTASNPNCSKKDSFTVTINPLPVAPTVTTPVPLYCQNATASALSATATSGNTLLWYTVATGGTGSTTVITPSTTSSGTISYYVSQVNSTTQCESGRSEIKVTIKASPTISLNNGSSGTTTSCGSSTGTIVLSGLASNTQYTVNYDKSGTPVTATISSVANGTLSITGLPSGTYSNIRVTLAGCPSNMAGPFTISDPNPPATPVANSVVALCSGNNFTLSVASPVSGTTYLWTGPSYSQTTTNGSVTITNASAAASGVYSVTATLAGCTSAAGTTTVTVNQTPTAPVVQPTIVVCSGNSINLTASTVSIGTGTISYAWTGQNSFSSTDQNPVIAGATTNMTGNYQVKAIASVGNCASTLATTVVTVNPTPVITATGNNPSTCAQSTGSIAISGLANGSYTVNYTIGGVPKILTAQSPTGGTITIPTLVAGTYTDISVTLSNCKSNIVEPITLSDPNPPTTPSINPVNAVCSGKSLTLSINSPDASNTYTWSGQGGITGTGNSITINNIKKANAGTVSVTATKNSCASAAGTIIITVDSTPIAPTVTPTIVICNGNSINLTASTVSIGTGTVSYAWTGVNSFSSTNQNPVITNATTSMTGNYQVKAIASDGGCESALATTVVTVNQTPVITATGNNPITCAQANGSITIGSSLPNGSYTVNYTIGGIPKIVTAQNPTGGTITIPALVAGTYTDISVTLNNCKSNILGPITLVDPNPPTTPIITVANAVCSGTSLTLNITSPDNTLTYTWSGQGGISGTGNSITILKTIMANNGTLSVTATKNSCTSDAGTIVIKIDSTPVAPTVTTPINICSNNTINLTASTVSVGAGSINYAWAGPNSFSNANQNTSITNAPTTATGTYSVTATATNGNCVSAASNVLVTVNPTPVISDTSSSNPNNCATASGSFTFKTNVANKTFTVYYNDGSAKTKDVTSDATGYIKIDNLLAGTYSNISVKTIPESCNSNTVGPFTLTDPTPPTTPVITGDSVLCSGKNLTLNSPSVTDATYKWLAPNGNTIATTQNLQLAAITTGQSGLYKLTITLNNCTSSAGFKNVLVDSTPATPSITANTPICSNGTLNLSASTLTAGTINYAWVLVPNSLASLQKDTSLLNVQPSNSGLYSVTATAIYPSITCVSQAGTKQITVNPTPVISDTSSSNPDKCATATGSFTFKTNVANKTFTVYYNDGSPKTKDVTSDANGHIKIDNLFAGTYSNISVKTSPEGCTSNTVGPFTLTDPTPPTTPVITGDSVLCSGKNLTLNTPSVTNATYKWQAPNNAIIATTQNLQLAAITTGQSGVYRLTVTVDNCISSPSTKNVLVDSTPAIPSVSSNAPLCSGSNLALKANTVSPGNMVYAWIGPNGFTNNAANPTIPNVTETASGTYIVSATATVSNCVSDTANIVVLVRPELTKATISGLDSLFICGFAPPANASQQLTGSIDAARAFEKGKWSIISQPTGGNGVFTYDTTASTNFAYAKSGLYNIAFTITNDINCPATKDTVVLSIIDKPAIANELKATATSICAGNPVTIQVPLSAISGQIKYWQFKRPSSAANWQDTLVTNPSITFNNVQDTFRVRLVVIATDQLHCISDTAFKEILINAAPPSLPGVSSGEDTVCQSANSGSITLTGNIGLPVSWQLSTDGTYFTNIAGTAAQNYTYTSLTVNTWFRAAVKSGACDTVFSNATKITVYPPVKAAIAGSDAELCGDSTYQLSGNLPGTYESGLWSFAAGSPTASFDDATKANTTLRNMQPNNNYELLWTLSNGICPSTSSKIIIKNYLPLTNTIDSTSITVCNSAMVTATGAVAVGGNEPYLYQWQSLKGNVWVNITGANNPSYSFTADTTVKLRRLVTATPCTNISLEKTVYVQPPLANNTITGETEACINTSPGVLVGSMPIGGDGNYLYQWQILQGSNWVDIAGASQKNYTMPVLLVNTAYRRLVTSALCSGNQGLYSSQFEITVRPDAEAKWTITKDTACAPFVIDNAIVTPTLVPSKNVDYSWYANGTNYGSSATINPSYTLTKAGDSITIKMVANSLYGCKNDSLSHVFFTIPPVLTNFTVSDTAGCGPLKINFNNTTPYLGFFTYQWNFGNNQASTLAQPGSITYAANPNFGDTTYLISLTATSECESVIKTRTVTVASRPKSIFTPSKTTGCSPLTVSFTNLSKGIGVTYLWNFGDGNVLAASNKQSVSHVFTSAVQDTFLVKLIAMNQCGNDTSTYNIVVSPNQIRLDLAVNGNQKQVCKPATVGFINATSGATSFNWNFGDGNVVSTTKNLDTVSHTFLQAGNYTVTLFATNGCSDTTTTELIQVFNAPSANFNAVPTTVCLGDTIRFTNQSDTITSLLWNFKDSYTSTVINPTHAYKVAGIYNVQLTAIRQYNSGLACVDSISKPITVLSTLPGAMKVSDSISSCVPFTTTFTNLSVPSAITIWQFGNGVADTGNVVTYTYTKVGNYTVNMLATNSGGCKFAATANVQVNGPEGIWQHDKGFVCGATAVRYEVFATGTDSVRWDFGDGISITTSGKIIYHTYTKSGIYLPSASLINSSLKGCTVTLKAIDTIKVDYVSAGFTISDNKTCSITTVTFTDTSRSYFPIANYSWSFGNGNSATTRIATQQYTTTNTWQTDLTITSTSGCSNSVSKNSFIKVNNYPKVSIQTLPIACINKPTNYFANVTSNDSINLYSWQFSNGVSLNGQSVNNLYNTVGNYTAKVLVSTIYGCADSITLTHTLNPTPTVVASVDQLICRGKSVPLSVSGAATYSWIPLNSNLSCYTCTNPIAAPITTTNYIVTGYNSFGCSDDDTVLITVAQPIKLTVSPNDTICIGQSSQLIVTGATSYVWSPSIGLSNTTSATPLATPNLTTKYQVIGFDNHNCFQDTAYVVVAVGQYPTIQLAADQVLATGTLLPLNYTSTNGPLTTWKWTPNTNLNCNDCAVPIATIKKDVCYTVVAANMYKCAATDTICIKVFCENTQVFIPNVFTPDNDGVNDILMVRGTGIKTVKSFRIFNRWGQIVFERGNITPNNASQGWDGKINGTPASPDVYVYTCEVVCENDVTFTYKGNVAIIK